MSSSGEAEKEESIETPNPEDAVSRVKHQISIGEMPSTATLMAAMRANPFEANFAEANRRLSNDLSPASAKAPPQVVISASDEREGDDSDSNVAAAAGGFGKKLSRKSSANSGLSLKLPPTLTSQSPGLFSNVGLLQGPLDADPHNGPMDTPEIARLVKQVQDPGQSRVPGTAEVLESVLTIETTDSGGMVEAKMEPMDKTCLGRVSSPPSLPTAANGLPNDSAMVDLGSGGSTASDEPPSISTSQSAAAAAQASQAAAAASSLGGEVVGNSQEGYFLQLRVGNQMMRIPFDVALGATKPEVGENSQDSQDSLSHSWAGPSLTPGMGGLGGSHSAASSRGVSPVNPKLKMDLGPGRGQKRSHQPSGGATSDGGTDLDDKRKDTLERNKAAAIRYRKRKKEELVMMQDKVRKVEEEKFELQTQVTVLKRELERLGKKLDMHRGCNCPCEAKAKLEAETGVLSHHSHMGLGPSPASMPYILQPVMLPHSTSSASVASTGLPSHHQLLNFVLPPKVSPLSQQHSPHLSSQP